MTVRDRAQSFTRSMVDLGDPVGWAVAIGILLVQGRDPVTNSDAGLGAVIFAQVAALKLGISRPRTALAVSVGVQLVACATGVSPTIGVGAVVVCAAAAVTRGPNPARTGVLSPLVLEIERPGAVAYLAPLAGLAVVAYGPWLLHMRASAVLAGAARSSSPTDVMLYLFFAYSVRMNWNFLDTLMRGASQRAEDAEAARDVAIAGERARIARELHDVVAHQMAVVVAQAQGAQAVAEREPERARQALETISRTTRDALVEMRRLVAIDRPEGVVVEPATAGPMPGLGVDELGQLADNAEAAGLEVRMTIELTRGTPVPPGIALAAHRTVQEALTNAAKHAPGAEVDVHLTQSPTDLTVSVTNGPGTGRPIDLPGSGVGLVGMRERVDFYGGTLDAGPAGGGWSVLATFPTLEAPSRSE